MSNVPATKRPVLKTALIAAAVLTLSACASDPGEKVVDEPFPELADVPPKPEAATTAGERKALKAQLQRRREEIQNAAASLLRGGTEPVPVDLESQVPEAPDTGESQIAPPPLPNGLPQPPERPESFPNVDTSAQPAEATDGESDSKSGDGKVIDAPEEAQMPPAKAAGESEEGAGGGDKDEDAADDG